MSDFGLQRNFEFWLGRAGSGKTRACLDAIARTASDQPRGSLLLLLVPEQATAQAEYELATQSNLAGYTRARVVSFDYLRREVFRRLGGKPATLIDEPARVMLLRQIIRLNRQELRVLASSAGLPGLAESVSAALTEFQRYGWKRADLTACRLELRNRLAQTRGESVSLLETKLADLELVWGAYESELSIRGLHDVGALGPLAAEKLPEWPELEGARVWIDGFVSFTAEETRLLEALLQRTEAAAMTLCLDPHDPVFMARERGLTEPGLDIAARLAMILGPSPRIGAERTFENLEQTCFQLRERLTELGWRVSLVDFPRPDQPATRFEGSHSLAHLESGAITRLQPAVLEDAAWRKDREKFTAWPLGPVELIEAESKWAEVAAVARRLAALRGSGFCWRQMAVLTRGLDDYAPLVREIFPRHGVPFFLDQRRAMVGHPLARLLVSALEMAGRDWHSDSVKRYLKSGLSPVADRDTIARIERLANAKRLRSSDWFDASLWNDPPLGRSDSTNAVGGNALFSAWTEAAEPVRNLRQALAADGVGPAEALWRFLSDCRAGARVAQWAEQARASGDEETALLHIEAWREVVSLLDRVHQIGLASSHNSTAPDNPGAAEELLEIVETGLASIRAGLIPPTLDQVLVGSVDRTRTPPVRAAFVLGMNDGEFPRLCEEDPFLGDGERRQLSDFGKSLAPDSRRRFDHERFLAYIALTRASEYLCVSRTAAAGDTSQSGGASSYFRAVAEALPHVVAQPVFADSADTFPPDSPILAETWAREVAQAVHNAESTGAHAPLAHVLAMPHPLSVAAWHHPANAETASRVRATLAALAPACQATLDPELVRRFWLERPVLSITGIETYAACPFKFFTERMLRLERPPDPMPGPPALGSLRHAVMERLFQQLANADGRLNWGEINLDETRDLAETCARELMDGKLAGEFGRDTLTRHVVTLAVEEIKVFIGGLRSMGERYHFDQFRAEFKIHEGPHPMRLTVDDELSFTLKGTIDRLDASREPDLNGKWMLLFDYKTSKNKLDFSRLWDGTDLQLPAYALAMRSLAPEWHLGGFFYWPMSLKLESAKGDSQDWATPGSPEWFKRHRPVGCYVAEVVPLLDDKANSDQDGLAFNIQIKQDNNLYDNTTWLKRNQMEALLDRILGLMQARAKQISEGNITQNPLRLPKHCECEQCDHAARCRIASFPDGTGRTIESVKLNSVLRARLDEREDTQ